MIGQQHASSALSPVCTEQEAGATSGLDALEVFGTGWKFFLLGFTALWDAWQSLNNPPPKVNAVSDGAKSSKTCRGNWTCVDITNCTWCVQVLRSPKEAFAAAMQSWRERCGKCVCLQGDYVEK